MKNKLTRAGRKFAKQQIIFITIVVLCSSIVTWFIWGQTMAMSVLTGGLVGLIPQVIFALKAFKHAGASASKLVVENFYSGVKLKMLYTALLFALVFKFLAVEPLVFLSTYCVVVFLPLLMPVILTKR